MTAPGNKKRGMVLPFTPLSITFLNVGYSVDIPQVCLNHKRYPILTPLASNILNLM